MTNNNHLSLSVNCVPSITAAVVQQEFWLLLWLFFWTAISEPVSSYFTRTLRVLIFCLEMSKIVVFAKENFTLPDCPNFEPVWSEYSSYLPKKICQRAVPKVGRTTILVAIRRKEEGDRNTSRL